MNSSGVARTATPAIKPSSRGSPDAHTFSRQSSSYHERSTPNGALTAQHRLPPTRMAATACLMGSGAHLLLPSLDCVPLEYHFHAGECAAIRLAQALLELDIAEPSDWRRVRRDPTDYVQATLNRWIDLHGGKALRRRFCLRLMLSEVVDEYTDAGESDPDGRRLYLFLHPDSAAFVVAGPTLELMAQEHPRLPATFYHLFTGALNRWVSS